MMTRVLLSDSASESSLPERPSPSSTSLSAIITTFRASTSGFVPYLDDLEKRGVLSITYPQNLLTTFKDELNKLPPLAYAGFDPSSDSLHVGNLIIVLNLLRAHFYGIRPILLIGGATAAIGDPSGRLSERNTLEYDVIHTNRACLFKQLQEVTSRIIPQDKFDIFDNYDWYKNLSCLDFLRRCKSMTMSSMLSLGAIRDRLDSQDSISFTEFSYQTLQAMDWLNLAYKYDCRFQVGGSDQLGHLHTGSTYIKKMLEGAFAAGICLPLLTDADGNKIGKSTQGGVTWLGQNKTSNFRFYQFFMQMHETEAVPLFTKLSLRPLHEVKAVIEENKADPGKKALQRQLAEEITKIVRGKKTFENTIKISQILFYNKFDEFTALPREELLGVFNRPVLLEREKAKDLTFGKLADITKEEGTKMAHQMSAGAFKVNGVKVTNPDQKINVDNILLGDHKDLTLIGLGKRQFNLVQWI
ncbi:hypothetical protein WR25_21378 [Diploscapter pachys]|uniref:Tyrosine--tRNA ligase n=1 Tax=Diploscapter pachys TaxID=2018661 RepID=A0A2A2L6M7_9BILA|nr:hypothetical protein WR25_21378 [Diploscapter pachys]